MNHATAQNEGYFPLESPPERAWTLSQQIVRALHDAGLSDRSIAVVVNCRTDTINRIRNARTSGRNLEPYFIELYQVMVRSGAMYSG